MTDSSDSPQQLSFRTLAVYGLLFVFVFGVIIGGYHLSVADSDIRDDHTQLPDDNDMDTAPDPDPDTGADDTDDTTPEDLADGPMKPGAMVYFDQLLSSHGVYVTYVDVSDTTVPCPDIVLHYETPTTIEHDVQQDAHAAALAYADLTNVHPEQEYTHGDLTATVTDHTRTVIATYEIDNDTAHQYLDGELTREEYLDTVDESIEYQFARDSYDTDTDADAETNESAA